MQRELRTRIPASRTIGRMCLIVLLSAATCSQAATATASQTLSASISPIGKLSVNASLPLTASGTTFVPFAGTLAVSYRVRTTPAGGGSITVQATTDFSPGGGPSISGGVLTYTCSGASLGTACPGTQTVTRSGQTSVVSVPASACTGGGGACSGADPNTVSLSFVLSNDPQYQTGTYSAQLTFTISAT